MKKINSGIVLFVCATFSISCADLKNNRLINMAKTYRNRYGTISCKCDSLIVNKDLSLRYKEGQLIEAGKMKNGKKNGKWFFYHDSLKLDYIIDYESAEVDTILKPFVLVNESW